MYDKRHPFGYEKLQEITPGTKNLFWQLDDWKATIQICSDLWNINDYSVLVTEDIDLVFCPILTTIPDQIYTNYGRFMWYNLAVIRAKEAASAIIVSDSAKQPIREPYWCAGASCIVDPSWRFTNEEPIGKNMLSSIPDGSRGIVTVTLDLNKIRQQRQYRKDMGLLLT
jgi:predicted amidohydrolase